MYIYPENLSAKPSLWFWYLTDIVIIGLFAVLSFADTSIIDYLIKSLSFLVYGQQFFEWQK